jgi:calcium-activated chloride channel regulator 4
MGLFQGLVFFLLLYLLQGSNSSFVKLNDNGYEDVIIAIDPGVPEDENIIEQLKVKKMKFFLVELQKRKKR